MRTLSAVSPSPFHNFRVQFHLVHPYKQLEGRICNLFLAQVYIKLTCQINDERFLWLHSLSAMQFDLATLVERQAIQNNSLYEVDLVGRAKYKYGLQLVRQVTKMKTTSRLSCYELSTFYISPLCSPYFGFHRVR